MLSWFRTAVCKARWSKEENTNVAGGQKHPADSLDDCQSACFNNASCNGIDWNPASPAGQRCWLGGPWSGPKNAGGATGITHYNLTRICEGKI